MNRRLILTAMVATALTAGCAGAQPTPQIIYAPIPTPQVVTLPTPTPQVIIQLPKACVAYFDDVDTLIGIEKRSWSDEAGKGVTQADVDALNALVPTLNADQAACGAYINGAPQS